MVVEMRLNCTGAWTDYSDNVNLSAFKVIESLSDTFDPIRTTSGEVEVTGDAYNFVYNNLIDNANMYSNSICLRITDTLCSSTQNTFKLETSNLKWCDNNECTMTFDLIEYNLVTDCIKDTLIIDNTNGEFQSYPTSGNPHPRFRYCDVVQPKWFFGIIISFFTIFDVLVTGLNALISIINLIINGINSLLPGTPIGNVALISLPYETFSGCDRGYPAPYIRTYIDNVCDLCGVTVDSSSAPIFYNTQNQFNALLSNPYYYACYLTAYTTKGVDMTGAKDFLTTNAPSHTLDIFLSEIKQNWNARWYIHNSNLYINRKDLIGDDIWGSTPTLDFTGTDKQYLLGSVCFSWNGEGKLRRLNMDYSIDASDNSGNEMRKRFRGEWLDPSTNLNYKESREVNILPQGVGQFVLDGQDVPYDSIILNAVGATLSGFNFKGCLKTQGDTLALAKVLIYDPTTDIDDARVQGDDYLSYIALSSFQDDQNASFSISPVYCKFYNNAMSFDPDADSIEGNLWQYWEIEKADPSKKTNIAFEFKIEYCCAFNALGLYQKVKMKNGWIGEIDFIEYDYANREILIKGNIL